MRRAKILELEPGLILAEPVLHNEMILLAEGTVLTFNDIERLKQRNIRDVYVYDEDDFILGKEIKVEFKDIPPVVESKKYKSWDEHFDKVKDITKLNENPEELDFISHDIYQNFLKQDDIILNFFHAIGDKSLTSHSLNTAIISSIIAQKLRMPEMFTIDLLRLSLIHDLGYTFINQRVTFDYENLEDKTVKAHVIAGYKVFEHLKSMFNKDVINAILDHHERYDGKGILIGKKEEIISPLVRIMQIGDAYDSMIEIEKTPYEAISFLLKNAGKIFDPYYVSVFFSIAGVYPTGTVVELSNGQKGKVIMRGKSDMFPVIEIDGKKVFTGPENKIFIRGVIND